MARLMPRNEPTRSETVSTGIVYSVRIGPPQPKNLSFQQFLRTPQPSELTISSFNGREQNRSPMTKNQEDNFLVAGYSGLIAITSRRPTVQVPIREFRRSNRG
jgi:hypothetical protein